MRVQTYYIILALMTVLLSFSYFKLPGSLLPVILALADLAVLTHTGPRLHEGKPNIGSLVPFALLLVLSLFDYYAIIPLVIYAVAVYLYVDGKETYSRALISSTITAFSYPISYLISSYDMLLAPLLILQASGLAIVKEAIYPGKRALGAIAYSIPFTILLALTFGRWMEMATIGLIGLWVYRKVGREVMHYESVLKLLAAFSIVSFASYILPIYVFKLDQRVYHYLSLMTGFS